MGKDYTNFFKSAMIPAFGCTEPIALAYAAAVGRKYIEKEPVSITVKCSGNLIKNARAVVVPNSGGLKGMEISTILGAVAGNPDKKLEVLTDVNKKDIQRADELNQKGICKIQLIPGLVGLYIDCSMEDQEGNQSRVVIQDAHTNIIKIEQNGKTVFEKDQEADDSMNPDFSFDEIYEFAKNCDLAPLQDVLDKMIEYNSRIAEEGLTNPWGAQVGKTLYDQGSQEDKEIAHAAAGSDARMSGCEMPVVINSGSGNQGMTLSLPIIERAKNINAPKEDLYRALIFSALIAEYQKQYVGKLSAFCGAASAAASAGGGLAFLEGQPKQVIADTISNALVTMAGLICDGAKPSCAAKIAISLKMAYTAYNQAKEGRSFVAGDGLVGKDIDATIRSIGRVAREGMEKTDIVILDEMMDQ